MRDKSVQEPVSGSLSPIRVAQGGRYFETFDGEPFLFVGPNDAITWPGLEGLYRRKDLRSVDSYLESLATQGVTVLRLMLEYAHREGRYFEKPVGHFNPAMVRLWDDLFARCERYGLRVLLLPWDNFWMARRWHRHPYNRANGGPAEGPHAFFTDEATIAATIRRFEFVIERWGGSGVLAAWDLFNELHPHWGGTPEEQSAVIARLSAAVRKAEFERWGFTRPQTVSIFGPQPDAGYEDLIFRHPSLDFATTHIYQGAIDFPRDTVAPAVVMGDWVRYALARTPPNRPFLDSEHGPIHLFNDHRKFLPEEVDDQYERHLMWAHLASGGAGSGMRWPARHPHTLTEGMKSALKSLSNFTRHVAWNRFQPRDAVTDVKLNVRGVQIFACHDERQALIWLLRGKKRGNPPGLLPSRPAEEVILTLRGLEPGSYRVLAWDTQRGCPHPAFTVTSNSRRESVCLPIPLANDLALCLQPEEA